MNRRLFMPIASLALVASCNQQSPPAPDAVVIAAPAPQPEAIPQPTVVQTPKKEEPPPVFSFPADAAGKLLPKVVAPPAPSPLALEKFGKTPTSRIAPSKLIAPEPLSKMIYAAPPLLPAKPAGVVAPTAPSERVPLELGLGATAVPARPVLPDSPGIVLKARDVKLLPDLVPLGRQLADRASLDDPTAEPGNAVIVNRTPMPVLGQAGFLKVGLPDPFEFAEHVKAKLAAAAEPSTAPVVVSPQRTK